MAGNDSRRAKDIKKESFGSGLLRRARDAIAGRSRQIDDTVDNAQTGRQNRSNRNRRNRENRGLRR